MYEHYCMGELAQASLSDDLADKDQCSKCGMEKKKGEENDCCKDEQKLVKTDDQNPGVKLVINKSLITTVELPSYNNYGNAQYSTYSHDITTGLAHAPPQVDVYKYSIFIRVQSLLI